MSKTVSASGELSMGAFKALHTEVSNGLAYTVLVAPNKRIQAQWRKEYPGYKVLLSRKLPTTSALLKENKNGM